MPTEIPVPAHDPLLDGVLPELRALAVKMAEAQAQAETARRTALEAMAEIESRLAGVDAAKASALRQLLGLQPVRLAGIGDEAFAALWRQHGPAMHAMIGCSRQRAYARARALGLEAPARGRPRARAVAEEDPAPSAKAAA